jgi:hypothetical protein
LLIANGTADLYKIAYGKYAVGAYNVNNLNQINIDTDGRLVWTRVHREFFRDQPEQFDFRKPGIIVVTHGQAVDSFWSVVRNGVETAAKETDTNVDYRWPGTFDVQGMAQLIDEAVAAKPDALVVSIPDAKALSKCIKAAVAAKIPVISINSRAEVFRQLGCLMYRNGCKAISPSYFSPITSGLK